MKLFVLPEISGVGTVVKRNSHTRLTDDLRAIAISGEFLVRVGDGKR